MPWFIIKVLMFAVCGLLTIVSTSRLRSVPVIKDEAAHPLLLQPIAIAHYETALGLQRREAEDFSNLDLQTQSELIFGSAGDKGQLLLANMTLYAPDGLLMIMMERFEGLTSAVDCQGDDGSMSLTFTSEDSFNYALQEWTFINENDGGKFLLIANHDGCGPDDERQPYLISRIDQDASALTTYLTAQPVPWSDVAGSYDLDFGQAIPYQRSQKFKERGFWGDIEGVAKDVGDAFTGSVDLSKSVDFDVSVGQQGQTTNIYTDPDGQLTLDCINCFVTGSFQVAGHLSVSNFQLNDLTLTASPNNFLAELELEATITSTDEPKTLQYSKTLYTFPIPDAGIAVSGIFSLGATLSYDVGVGASFQGSAVVDFGLQAGLPDNAQLTADISDPGSSSATGFGGGSLTPLFDIKQETASLTLSAYSQPKLSFGVELDEVGKFDVAVSLKLPEVSLTLTAEYNEAGACSQNADASTTAVKLDSDISIELDLEITASLGDDDNNDAPSWSQPLFSISEPLFSDCYPMAIPGLQSGSNATSVPTAAATTVQISSVQNSGVGVSGASSQLPYLKHLAPVKGLTTLPASAFTDLAIMGTTGAPSLPVSSDTRAPIASSTNLASETARASSIPPPSTHISDSSTSPSYNVSESSTGSAAVQSTRNGVTSVTSGSLSAKSAPLTSVSASSSSPLQSNILQDSSQKYVSSVSTTDASLHASLKTLTTDFASLSSSIPSYHSTTIESTLNNRESSLPSSSDSASLPTTVPSDHVSLTSSITSFATSISANDPEKAVVQQPQSTSSSVPSASPSSATSRSLQSPSLSSPQHIVQTSESSVSDNSPTPPSSSSPPSVSSSKIDKDDDEVKTSSSVVERTSAAKSATTHHVAATSNPAGESGNGDDEGVGGCKMVRRFGRRMIVC